MKTTTILFAAAVALLSSSAYADTGYGKTRAEVKAETLRAIAAGEVSSGGEGYPALSHPTIDTRAKAVAAVQPAAQADAAAAH